MKMYYVSENENSDSILDNGISAEMYEGIVVVDNLKKAHFRALRTYLLKNYTIYEINELGITGEIEFHSDGKNEMADHYFIHQTFIKPEIVDVVEDYALDDIFDVIYSMIYKGFDQALYNLIVMGDGKEIEYLFKNGEDIAHVDSNCRMYKDNVRS